MLVIQEILDCSIEIFGVLVNQDSGFGVPRKQALELFVIPSDM